MNGPGTGIATTAAGTRLVLWAVLVSVLVSGALVSGALVSAARATDYPERPLRLVIPFPAGGSNDVVGRLAAGHLGDRLGRQLVVDNRSGAGGAIGTDAVAKSPPDGYTLLLVSMAHTVNPWLYRLSHGPGDFAPVALIAQGENVLVVHPSVPATSVMELIALAKDQPGVLDYASAGVGTFQHLGGEMFKLMAGVDMVHVPFRGGGPSMLSVIGGHTKVSFPSLAQSVPAIRSGQLRALGTGGRVRTEVLPEVPTIAEAGVPGYDATNWWGIVAPAATPAAIVERLHGEINALLRSPQVARALASEGATPAAMTSAAFGEFMARETEKWGRVVERGGLRMQ
jgi:tripartite-type tricarboxylate transporter receptor subunit TctC